MKKILIKKKKKCYSYNLILKEAFKLFLQKNVEKVTVPELERVTGIQRGAIFYHFKDKETLFIEVINEYFFSELNIFYPLDPEFDLSLDDYLKKKEDNLKNTLEWFHKENLSLNPYRSFIHLASQAYLYDATFKNRMQQWQKIDKVYWNKVVQRSKINLEALNQENLGCLYRLNYIGLIFDSCYTS